MSMSYKLLALMAVVVVTGCQNQPQMLQNEQFKAVNVAVARGRFELDCPKATGSVLSSNMLQPALWGGLERSEYTVGVEGCGKRATYIVVCQVDSVSCVAASGAQNAPISR